MRVLLVEPPISPFDVPTGLLGLPEPLALETVAAGLCARHEVEILDMRLETDLAGRIAASRPDVVGVGAVTANLHLAKEVLRQARQIDPGIKTVIGGHHVTFRPQDAQESFIDAVVVGEGDYSLAELVEAWSGQGSVLEVRGLALNGPEGQIRTGQRPLADLDRLPLPARALVEGYRSRYFQRQYRSIVSLNTSRGCPFRCSFCTLWKANRGSYRARSAELVVEEIAGRPEGFIDFIDDNSLAHSRRMRKMAHLLERNGIRKPFRLYGRADSIVRDPELIEELAAVGLQGVLVGLEAATQERLDGWNKKGALEANERAIEILQARGLQIASYFLVDPAFEERDFEALQRYVERWNLADPVFTILVPFPGSDLYERERSSIKYDDPRLFDFFHTTFEPRLPLEVFYQRFTALWRNAYSFQRQLRLAPPGVPREAIAGKALRFEESLKRLERLASHHLAPLEALAGFAG